MGLDELTAKRGNRNVNPDLIPKAGSMPRDVDPDQRDAHSAESLHTHLNELYSLLERSDGYFRWRRDPDSTALHMTWTWKLGRHAERYVYVQVGYWQFWEGLSLLVHKINSADDGLYHTSPSITMHRP